MESSALPGLIVVGVVVLVGLILGGLLIVVAIGLFLRGGEEEEAPLAASTPEPTPEIKEAARRSLAEKDALRRSLALEEEDTGAQSVDGGLFSDDELEENAMTEVLSREKVAELLGEDLMGDG